MRSRNIKPGFFKNEILAECEPLARILFEGLWLYADREGRFEWRPKRIKAEILPYDECNLMSLLCQLQEREFIVKYNVNGAEYGFIPNFPKHQNPHPHEAKSKIPSPEDGKIEQIQCHDMSMTSKLHVSDMSAKSNADSLIPDSLIPDSLIPSTCTSSYEEVGFRLPSNEEISESAEPKLMQDLDKICEQLYSEKLWSKVHAFKNKAIKKNVNPRALLHALCRCYIKKPPEPWGYCVNILKVEDGNFNERDFRKTARSSD